MTMADMVKRDDHKRPEARGRVRMVCRTLGPLEFMENPYEAAS